VQANFVENCAVQIAYATAFQGIMICGKALLNGRGASLMWSKMDNYFNKAPDAVILPPDRIYRKHIV
jgi:hypothetical protein